MDVTTGFNTFAINNDNKVIDNKKLLSHTMCKSKQWAVMNAFHCWSTVHRSSTADQKQLASCKPTIFTLAATEINYY